MSKYLKEGEQTPFGYGFVAHRYDMLATEVAVLPLNYIIRFIRNWQMKSYKQMTREELKQLKKVQAIVSYEVAIAVMKEKKKNMDWFKKVLSDNKETIQ